MVRHSLFVVCALMALFTAPSRLFAKADGLVINEIQVANVDMFIDPSFNYGAWVEIYNPTPDTISLTNMQLRHTDSEGTMKLQLLTALHGTLYPQGYCCLWFDHNKKDGYYGKTAGEQIPFKLDLEGGLVELVDSRGAILDAVAYPAGIPRSSYARLTDGGSKWGLTSTPTPSRSNAGSLFAEERLAAPVADTKGGVFSDSLVFQVFIPSGAVLHYTTDGSTPVPGVSPVSVTGLFSVSETSIYRFMLTAEGYLNSPVLTRSFFRHQRDYYLPIVSVATHPDHLFGDSIGLYVGGLNGRVDNHQSKPMNQNMDWERPVNVEYFVPDTLTGLWYEALNQEATFSIFGGWTRFNQGDSIFQFKPSFKLKAEKVYEGLNYYPYQVFSAKPYIKNKTLMVRNGGQDQHGRIWDATIQHLIHTSGLYLDCQATQPAHIFLDGLYLGMFNLREASNRNFAYSNYGIGSEEVDQWENEFEVKAGSGAIYSTWYSESQKLANNPTSTSIWESICNIVDVDEYCNYMAAEIYMGNLDWLRSGFKNIKGFRCNKDDGKIHVVLFDLDGCFGDTNMIVQVFSKGRGRQVEIFKNMLQYEPFLQQFIDAYCLMGGSVFLPERCLPIIRSMEAERTIALEWEGKEPHTKADKLCDILSDRENQHQQRINNLIKQLKLTDELQVDISASTPLAGILLNGREIPTARFSGSLFGKTELTAVIPVGHQFLGWQVDDEIVSADTILDLRSLQLGTHSSVVALFREEAKRVPPIRINEVSSANDIYISDYQKKSDWIELYNTTDSIIDLTGMYLSDNPANPRKYQISSLPSSPSMFNDQYSMVNGQCSMFNVPPHGYRIVWCDNREPLDQLHAGFKLENADSAYVSIQAADGSWTDSLRYQAQTRWQSFGRFPDGADCVALLDRITIEQPNHILTQTQLIPVVPTDITELPYIASSPSGKTSEGSGGRGEVSIQYYNLNGQRLRHPEEAPVFIRRIIYSDGTVETTKMSNRLTKLP